MCLVPSLLSAVQRPGRERPASPSPGAGAPEVTLGPTGRALRLRLMFVAERLWEHFALAGPGVFWSGVHPHIWMRLSHTGDLARKESRVAAPPGRRGLMQLYDSLQAPRAASEGLRGAGAPSGHLVSSHTPASLPDAPSGEGWRPYLARLHVGSSPHVLPWSPASRIGSCRSSCPGRASSELAVPPAQAGASWSPWSTHVCPLHRHVHGGRWDWGPHTGTQRPAHFHLGLVLQAGLVPLLLHQGAGRRWQ